MSLQEEWRARDRRVLWHPFTQQNLWAKEEFPVIARGEGVYLFDLEGRRYLDGVSSLWVCAHGHNHPALNQALLAQLSKIAHSTFLGLSHQPGIELAEELIKIASRSFRGKKLTRVFYAENGASAVEIALKMAFQYGANSSAKGQRKDKFVCLTGAYHGDTVGAMSLGGIELFIRTYQPLLFQILRAPAPYCYRCSEGRQGCAKGNWRCFQRLEKLVKKHSSEIAGLFIEPIVQCASGMVVQPQGFLKAVAQLCQRYKILLIADEVAVGLGRLGKMFACELESVQPDLLVLGKALGAGYLPLACVLAREEIFSSFLGSHHSDRTFFHGHTYTANPLACAVALMGLKLFEREKRLENVKARAKQMKRWWKRFYQIRIIGEIRQCGLLAGIELVKDQKSREPFPEEQMIGFQVARKARELGAILRPLGNVVVLMPPLNISEPELEELMKITFESIKEVAQELGAN